MASDNRTRTQLMRRLAIIAGREIMDIYGTDGFEVDHKADDSPVTIADKKADAIIFSGLKSAYPSACIVTEEQADTHAADASAFFIVDPLDGTKEFIKRRGEFTVNIAWVVDGVPVAGVVYAPAVNRLFTCDGTAAFEGAGHFDPDILGPTKKLSVSQPDSTGLTVVASKSHRDVATDTYIERYNVSGLQSAGSSLKFCLVAAGEAHLYPRLGRTMEWDTAAGHAVLTGAGGQVVRADTLEPLTYGKPAFENPHFIACSPGVDVQAV